jgi:peptidoglycan/LPS O-acetylase OafA/YrhL
MIDSKQHYQVLDSLRGLAAIIVVCYHIFEGFSFAQITNQAGDGLIRIFNHGYLAVDFFFLLSGFVINYAYNDRWDKMTTASFFKRRLIRLHPMLIVGAFIGLVCFLIGGSKQWGGIPIPITISIITFLLTCFMIPTLPGSFNEIRGNGELFPLNGPMWSLFFEYIGNILYAIFIRRLSTKLLTILVVILGLLHSIFAIGNLSGYGSIGVGWTFDTINFFGGMLRMLFPFTLGMIISRKFKSIKLPYPFLISAIILITTLSIPYLSPLNAINLNGIYEEICIAIIFPLIVIIGASSKENSRASQLLGEISYPLYIIHYPIMYLFYQWLIETKQYTLQETYPVALFVVFISIILAFVLASFYDKPIRKRLKKYS